MTVITKELTVDIGGKYPEILTIPAHELNVSSFYLKVTLWYEGVPFNIDSRDGITATLVTNGILVTDERECERVSASTILINLSNENGEDPILRPGKMLVQVTINSQNGNSYTLPIVIVANVAEDIKQSAQITPESYGSTAEILQEVALARDNFNTLGDRLDNIDLKKLTFENLGSTSDTAVFENNKSTGKLYAVNLSGTSYWFFNTRIGTDAEIQYRFSKYGIEIKGANSNTWLNIGGKGDEVVDARGTFLTLAARLTDMTSKTVTAQSAANAAQSTADSALAGLTGKLDFVSLADAKSSTVFDNNTDVGKVYKVKLTVDGVATIYQFFTIYSGGYQFRYSSNGLEMRRLGSGHSWHNIGGEGDEVVAARGGFADLDARLDDMTSKTATAQTTADTKYQAVSLGTVQQESPFNSDTYCDIKKKFLFRPVADYLEQLQEAGYDVDSNTIGTLVYESGCQILTFYNIVTNKEPIIATRKVDLAVQNPFNNLWVKHNDVETRLSALEQTDFLIVQTEANVLSSATALDSGNYTNPDVKYIFKATGQLAGALNLSINVINECELTNNNGYQIVQPVNEAFKIVRKVNSVAPTWSADNWQVVKNSGLYIENGTIPFTALNSAVQGRIASLETALPNKLDVIDISEEPFMSKSAFNSYNFAIDKLYQVFLNGGILGAPEPSQVALVFQSNWKFRVIIGFKSGVYYSSYDNENEEWNDPVKSMDVATQNRFSSLENRVTALETANTILSNAINGVS